MHLIHFWEHKIVSAFSDDSLAESIKNLKNIGFNLAGALQGVCDILKRTQVSMNKVFCSIT